MSEYAKNCRSCALNLLLIAREYRRMNNPKEMRRLAKAARWHWHQYLFDRWSYEVRQ